MAIHLEIKTDLRVHDFLPQLLEVEKLECQNEIDSANYGEGYDLKYQNLQIRLYDDERSDEVMMNDDFRSGKLTWDQTFERVVTKNSGQGLLKMEIDRHDNCSNDEQRDAAKSIIDRLKEKYEVNQLDT